MNTFDENNFHEGQDFLTDYFYEQYDSEPKGITSFAVINYLLKEMPNIRRLLRWNQEKMSDILTEVFLKDNELKSLSIPERLLVTLRLYKENNFFRLCLNHRTRISYDIFEFVKDDKLFVEKINEVLQCAELLKKMYDNLFYKYEKTRLESDSLLLNCSPPNLSWLTREDIAKIDEKTKFFGGFNWKNIHNDLKGVRKEDYLPFVMSLYVFTVLQQFLYTYFPEGYVNHRKKSYTPEFGWYDYALHFEKPWKLITVAIDEKYLDKENLIKTAPEFCEFFECIIRYTVYSNCSGISYDDFVKQFLCEEDIMPENISDASEIMSQLLAKLK